MTVQSLPRASTSVPSKCAGHGGPGVPANPCTRPGSLPRCQLCPASPNYWRRVAA